MGIVIPTLFERPNYLFEAIASIREAGDAHILLCSQDNPELVADYIDLVDEHQVEQSSDNLATKINGALSQLPEDCIYIGWLSDDDLLTRDSLRRAQSALDANPELGLVYGSCHYINAQGENIGSNPSGDWAKRLMRFGPFLIPQPASLFRRDAFDAIGGLDAGHKLAFDHDLFIRITKNSGAMFLNSTQAAFRWHSESLSVRRRWLSVFEASAIRIKNYPKVFLPPILIWEPIVILSTRIAGYVVSLRAITGSRNFLGKPNN